MRITKNENADLHMVLFENWTNYDKWAPFFYPEFVSENSKKVIAGVMTANTVSVNSSLDEKFITWLKEKDINIQVNEKKQQQ